MTAIRHPIIAEDMAAIHASRQGWERFAGKRVLVTGAAGFLAAYIVEFLTWLNEGTLAEPVTVLALGRREASLRTRFPHLFGRPDFIPVVADVCEPPVGIGHVDFIVHAASPASPKHYLLDPVGTARANTQGTLNMLDLARAEGARMLFLSSGTVYGQGSTTQAIAETDFGPQDPLDSRACYSESKRMGEAFCAAYARQYGVPAAIARISHTYGPAVSLEDGRVFADFVADVLAGRDIRLTGDGMDSRPFCYVADATVAFLALLLDGEAGEAYNVGMDEEMTILALAELMASLAPRPDTRVILPEKGREIRPKVRSNGHFDIAKMARLGWRPTTPPEAGFERTLRYFLTLPAA